LKEHHIDQSREFLKLRLRELGQGKKFSDDCLGALVSEAFTRAKAKAIFGRVSYGLFLYEVTKIARLAADCHVKPGQDKRVQQIMEFYDE
jgi:hypothetical protein